MAKETDEKTVQNDKDIEFIMPQLLSSNVCVESTSDSEIDCGSHRSTNNDAIHLDNKTGIYSASSSDNNQSTSSVDKEPTVENSNRYNDKNSELVATERPSTVVISESFSDPETEYESDCSDENNAISAVAGRCINSSSGSLPTIGSSLSYGNINVSDSKDVHIGSKTYFNGPVTIKQVVEPTADNKADNGNFSKQAFVISSLDLNAPNLNSQGPLHQQYHNWKCKGVLWMERRWGINIKCPILLSFLSIIITICICIMVVIFLDWTRPHNVTDPSSNTANVTSETLTDIALLPSNTLRMVERKAWVAQPANEVLATLKTPVPYVIITHTATEGCYNQSECVAHVRHIQTFHIESFGWSDIGYNFLVGGDGSAYAGRGWNHVGAHTKGYNFKSIGIAMIGTFTKLFPPERQYVAVKRLIELGIELGKISKDYKLYAHSQLIPTASPGINVLIELQKWPHFSTDVPVV